MHSTYCKLHSTETAIFIQYHVLDDILMSLDHCEDVVLVMLDLSVAFNTVDNNILISRLGSYFGFCNTVLQ